MRNSTIYTDKPRTFRRSSRKILSEAGKKNVGYGSNLQNVNKDMRSMYYADGLNLNDKEEIAKCKYWLNTGDTSIFTEEQLLRIQSLAQADQAGAEALIMAYDCRPAAYRQLFENDIKPHVFVALHLFKDIWPKKLKERSGVKIDMNEILESSISSLKLNPNFSELDKIIKDSDNWSLTERYYYLAKQTAHSANYGIEWAMFIMNILEKSGGKIVLTQEDGRYFLQVYRALFPEIPERNDRIRAQALQSRLLFNMFGHPYQITSYDIPESMMKELYAWGCQSTVGEITRIGICEFQEHVEENNLKWDFLNDCHDSFLTQGPLESTLERCEKMQSCLQQSLVSPVDGTNFRMKSEVVVGFNWGIFDRNNPEKNPLGLRSIKWGKD